MAVEFGGHQSICDLRCAMQRRNLRSNKGSAQISRTWLVVLVVVLQAKSITAIKPQRTNVPSRQPTNSVFEVAFVERRTTSLKHQNPQKSQRTLPFVGKDPTMIPTAFDFKVTFEDTSKKAMVSSRHVVEHSKPKVSLTSSSSIPRDMEPKGDTVRTDLSSVFDVKFVESASDPLPSEAAKKGLATSRPTVPNVQRSSSTLSNMSPKDQPENIFDVDFSDSSESSNLNRHSLVAQPTRSSFLPDKAPSTEASVKTKEGIVSKETSPSTKKPAESRNVDQFAETVDRSMKGNAFIQSVNDRLPTSVHEGDHGVHREAEIRSPLKVIDRDLHHVFEVAFAETTKSPKIIRQSQTQQRAGAKASILSPVSSGGSSVGDLESDSSRVFEVQFEDRSESNEAFVSTSQKDQSKKPLSLPRDSIFDVDFSLDASLADRKLPESAATKKSLVPVTKSSPTGTDSSLFETDFEDISLKNIMQHSTSIFRYNVVALDDATVSPTAAPTEEPTFAPFAVNFPTQPPVFSVPGDEPSVEPTQAPTEEIPSESPSATPSEVPSAAPSETPSEIPSELPSQPPSQSPSGIPTERPSKVPSTIPTIAPSAMPTDEPTYAPSRSPSEIPSEIPSETPSEVPSEVPSHVPSAEPTIAPSAMPTDEPTYAPSRSPSLSPSEPPSEIPSEIPSEAPSEAPSQTPTEVPSPVPSAEPTIAPSIMPTEEPTQTPTQTPSAVPTENPSAVSSDIPSEFPTTVPSEAPTIYPSTIPTEEPSETPSAIPSESPSDVPSQVPSEYPSLNPSQSPSQSPSLSPSIEPTDQPSEEPTTSPTESPSASPSEIPSWTPTEVPSETPWADPSATPSESPSIAPSSEPSETPTDMPSRFPSAVPTDMPSLVPSEEPSAMPSAEPTQIPSEIPSATPSDTPTEEPTFAPFSISLPTQAPDFYDEPTIAPSAAPTEDSSETPSVAPTIAPTETPTETASNTPSYIPTVTPSDAPSTTPLQIPTAVPSFVATSSIPSESPTEIPIEIPTTAPTEAPTESPTAAPSDSPSEIPSEAPSTVPSREPSAEPSREPSQNPSKEPSREPSYAPSHIPSYTPSLSPSTSLPSYAPSITPSLSLRPTATPTTRSPSRTPSGPTFAPSRRSLPQLVLGCNIAVKNVASFDSDAQRVFLLSFAAALRISFDNVRIRSYTLTVVAAKRHLRSLSSSASFPNNLLAASSASLPSSSFSAEEAADEGVGREVFLQHASRALSVLYQVDVDAEATVQLVDYPAYGSNASALSTSLSTQLSQAVSVGNFTQLLVSYAAEENVAALLTSSVDSVSVTVDKVTLDDDAVGVGSGRGSGLQSGETAAVVIGAIFFMLLATFCVYFGAPYLYPFVAHLYKDEDKLQYHRKQHNAGANYIVPLNREDDYDDENLDKSFDRGYDKGFLRIDEEEDQEVRKEVRRKPTHDAEGFTVLSELVTIEAAKETEEQKEKAGAEEEKRESTLSEDAKDVAQTQQTLNDFFDVDFLHGQERSAGLDEEAQRKEAEVVSPLQRILQSIRAPERVCSEAVEISDSDYDSDDDDGDAAGDVEESKELRREVSRTKIASASVATAAAAPLASTMSRAELIRQLQPQPPQRLLDRASEAVDEEVEIRIEGADEEVDEPAAATANPADRMGALNLLDARVVARERVKKQQHSANNHNRSHPRSSEHHRKSRSPLQPQRRRRDGSPQRSPAREGGVQGGAAQQRRPPPPSSPPPPGHWLPRGLVTRAAHPSNNDPHTASPSSNRPQQHREGGAARGASEEEFEGVGV